MAAVTPPTQLSADTLRLRLVDEPGHDRLDGGWWPRSRDLATEFAQLVDDFPPERGRIMRAVYSPPDWDEAPRRVAVRGRNVKVGHFPRDDTNVIFLTTFDRVTLCVLVVPPSFSEAQGEEALLAASTRGNTHLAGELLATVTNELDVDPAGVWK